MPKEHRKRGKKKRGNKEAVEHEAEQQAEEHHEEPNPQWMETNDDMNLEAPFGYVDPDVKGYFRTVDARIQDWQSQEYVPDDANEEGNTNEDKRMFLVAALSESSGKELQLSTDPDCSIILERMLHSMDDLVIRVFADRLCGSYVQLAQHRFGSHVCQTLLEVAVSTISRETRGRIAKPSEMDSSTGVLRTMTELVAAISEELLPSLSQLILDPFGAHVLLSLLVLLSPQITRHQNSSHPSNSLTRSKKSAAYKSRQGSMKSILASGADHTSTAVVPASFKDLASRFVDTLRESTDANEIRAFAANKVANPVLQAMIDLEAQQGKSDIPGSLIDSVLMGAISSLAQGEEPEQSDYVGTLLRDPTASHLFEALVRHAPERTFQALWDLYFKTKLGRLCSHPVANFVVSKAIMRLDSSGLLEALEEIDPASSKLIKTGRTGVLKSLVDQAVALAAHEGAVSEMLCRAVDIEESTIQLLVPCLLTLKSRSVYSKSASTDDPEANSEPTEPTVQGAVILQSMLKLSDPHNQRVVQSIHAQSIDEIIGLSRHPVSSRVLDAFLDSSAVPLRDKRKFLLSLMGSYHVLVDDRIGSRVGDRCWACADPFLREKIAKSILPHETALSVSYYGKYFARNLHLTMLKRDAAAWRDMQRDQKRAAAAAASNNTESIKAPPKPDIKSNVEANDSTHTKKRKRTGVDEDEIDVLFSKAPNSRKALVPSKGTEESIPDIQSARADDPQLDEVLGAIKKVSKKEGKRKNKKS
ncbi:Nucleolar protein 9 AltName: Full=Pumilio domain-containing protein NOP9 [Rhizoctonia solani AG-1 IB]|uniref:Nucleolar protein 9 n=1 Tax=Thanatephorus cucumeris (strain AG1-IB / isolate 7/3/14) TaxID=1108050 RepID=M5BL80_THACB|nr:Nucleolar protein 9 AltName: Full=Pumilio domain-containing protein NOP9 [Rhizoctonia solani AG-1 IB]